MKRFRFITIAVLVLSLIGNGWIGLRLYHNSRILQMQTASYNSFKSSLSAAVKATDAEKHDKPGSTALTADAVTANMNLERSIGIIWGLRADFAKKGMDIYPIFIALGQSENFSPYESGFNKLETVKVIDKNSRTLHDIESTLAPTSFTNSGLSQLQKAVTSFYAKYIGYPSYSKLQ